MHFSSGVHRRKKQIMERHDMPWYGIGICISDGVCFVFHRLRFAVSYCMGYTLAFHPLLSTFRERHACIHSIDIQIDYS
jgi:hypothetical protein